MIGSSRRASWAFRLSTVSICLLGQIALAAEPAAGDAKPNAADEHFNSYVLPILQKHCFECHSHAAGKAKGGLVLDSRGGWVKGGDSGPAIVPGKLDDSLLIQAVRYDDLEMPPAGKLSADEIATLQRWVAAGAHDPRIIDTAKLQAKVDYAEGRKHWAFQPVAHFAPPAVVDGSWPLDPLDRFVLAELEAHDLKPAADADRYTWLRRVSLDLTGLPPTPEQIADFIVDGSPQAVERVIDRLLASPAFGERWGRHWLDLVGYADQIGTANDIFAEHAWRYRDYVIAAFNADKPYDAFIREQLAGDLLPYRSAEQHASQLVATGFLLLGDLSVVEADKAKLRVDVVDQQLDKLGRAFLGMTLGCARCHDHKFDPISQHDYYALAGILNSTESVQKAEWGIWSMPTTVELPESDSTRAERLVAFEAHQTKLATLKAERDQLRARKAEIEAALKQSPPAAVAAAAPAVASAASTANNASPPASGEAAGSTDISPTHATLEKIRQETIDRLKKLDGEIAHAEFFTPARPRAFTVRDVATPGDMRITIRGDAHALGEPVPRGFLQVVAFRGSPNFTSRESGRRQLADWIASADNPLTARVAVNRVWQKLFGEGLVRSVDYFGKPGQRPTHPQLLDFLAEHFAREGWSFKRLIRAVALSRTYRMSSETDARSRAADPDNRLLTRMNRRRLDAEALRDSMLVVSGRLVASHGGPALPLEYLENTGNLNKGSVNPPSFRLGRFRPEQQYQRTVYLPIIRSAPQGGPGEIRNVFDFTQPAEFAGQRAITAVPTQALFLLNSSMMKARSRELAEVITNDSTDSTFRLERLWLRVYDRPLTDAERLDALAFLDACRKDAKAEASAAAESGAWVELCHALLASNEFLMRR